MKKITLVGRVDRLQVYMGVDVVNFFQENKKLNRKYKFDVNYLHHDEWNDYRKKLQEKHGDAHVKEVVFSYFHDENSEFFGNAGQLQSWAKQFGFKNRVKYDSGSDEEHYVKSEHFKVLEEMGNSQVFLEFTHGKEKLGRIRIELYEQFCPKSCKNFVNFCVGGVCCREGYTYKNSRIHRLNEGFLQGGDVVDSTGNNSLASFSEKMYFENECFDRSLMSDSVGVLGYIPCGRNGNGSQFYITLEDGSWMSQSGKYQNIGRVISGTDILKKLKTLETNESEKPIVPIVISDAGVFFQPHELSEMRQNERVEIERALELERRKKKLIFILTEEFEMIDMNKDGFIVLPELKKALEDLYEKKFSWDYVVEVLKRLDINKDSKISLHEYIESMFNLLTVDEMEEEFKRIKRQRDAIEIKKKKMAIVTEELRKSFSKCDVNGDGFITEDEVFVTLQILMGKIPSDEEIWQFFDYFDKNNSGRISYAEFESSMLKLSTLDEYIWQINEKKKLEKIRHEKKLLKAISHLRRSFHFADADNDGFIDSRELKTAYFEIDGQRLSDEDVQKLLIHCDKNGDDLISEEEYIESLLKLKTVDELISELKELERKIKAERKRKKNIAFIKMKLSQLFDRVDSTKSGVIDPNELRLMLKMWTGLLPSFEDTRQLYFEIDSDRSGEVEKVEWVRGVMNFFSIEENLAFIKKAKSVKLRVPLYFENLLIAKIERKFEELDVAKTGFISAQLVAQLVKSIICVNIGMVDLRAFRWADDMHISVDEVVAVLVYGRDALGLDDCFKEYEAEYAKDIDRQEREFQEEKVIVEISKIFHKIDIDWDGFIDRDELKTTLKSLLGREPTDNEFMKFLKKFDDDDDDRIEKSEFINGILRNFRMDDLIEIFK